MATLRDLQRALFPTARPIGGSADGSVLGPPAALEGERADREVGWVRVLKARVPAFDALDTGDLAIIPAAALAVVAPGGVQTNELAAALARAHVPAVILVEGESGADALDALSAAAVDVGLTVLRLGREDPVALERSIIGFLVNRRAELDRRAAELESQLARLVLRGEGREVLLAAIGSFTGRAVVIESRRGDPIAAHAPEGVPGAAAAMSSYLARPSGAALRVTIPVPAGEPGAGGRLVLLGGEPPTELERVASERIAAVLALELTRDTAVTQARDETRRGDPLPTDGPPWVVILASQGAADGPSDIVLREETRAELRVLLSSRRLTLRGTSESLELRLVAAAPADDPVGLAVAERLTTFLQRTVAVSRPFADPAGRPAAEAAARATLEAADVLRDPPPVARASRLPAYQLLGNLHNLPDGTRQARELLAPILVGRGSVQQERLATLRAVLETATLGEAAARLGVHRNTVAYRVARLESLGGWDLADPDLRLALGIAARIVQDAHAEDALSR
jgi:purine catabolism regulator